MGLKDRTPPPSKHGSYEFPDVSPRNVYSGTQEKVVKSSEIDWYKMRVYGALGAITLFGTATILGGGLLAVDRLAGPEAPAPVPEAEKVVTVPEALLPDNRNDAVEQQVLDSWTQAEQMLRHVETRQFSDDGLRSMELLMHAESPDMAVQILSGYLSRTLGENSPVLSVSQQVMESGNTEDFASAAHGIVAMSEVLGSDLLMQLDITDLVLMYEFKGTDSDLNGRLNENSFQRKVSIDIRRDDSDTFEGKSRLVARTFAHEIGHLRALKFDQPFLDLAVRMNPLTDYRQGSPRYSETDPRADHHGQTFFQNRIGAENFEHDMVTTFVDVVSGELSLDGLEPADQKERVMAGYIYDTFPGVIERVELAPQWLSEGGS